jgi:L-threonylcarbamoyladenylate synthase
MIKTMIYKSFDLEDNVVKKNIKKVFDQGGLVVFPTETVYGIGANALNIDAVKKIFIAKGRPSDNPLIVHLSRKEDIFLYTKNVSELAIRLIDRFMPGPFTVVLEKNDLIPLEVTGGLNSIAIRIPSNQVAQDIIKISELPICAPSANISGRPSSTMFSHVLSDFEGVVDVLVDGGKTNIGIESTVIDLTLGVPVLLRPGFVTKKMIEDYLGMKIVDATLEKVIDTPKSPGMKYQHYAPKGILTLVKGNKEDVIKYIQTEINKNKYDKSAVIGADEYLDSIDTKYKVSLGKLDDINEIASNIYSALREMDLLNIKYIYIHTIDDIEFGEAIMNRLLKASSYRVINLSD